MKCPACKQELRMKIHVLLDMPSCFEYRLTKAAIRTADVRIEGALWDRSTMYCECGFCLRAKEELQVSRAYGGGTG